MRVTGMVQQTNVCSGIKLPVEFSPVLLGKPTEQQKTETTPNVEDWSRDVESTAKALEGKIKSGDNIVVHAGDELIEQIDEKKLQRRDNGEYGNGFYVSKTEINQPYYGKIKSYFDLSNAKVLNEKTFDVNDWKKHETNKSGYDYNDVIKNPEKYDYNDLLKVNTFEDAVRYDKNGMNEYARKNGFDIFEATKDEIVVLNPKSVKSINEKSISEAYHKAKQDGSNPELVKAVEELLGKPTEQPKETIPNVSDLVHWEFAILSFDGVLSHTVLNPKYEILNSKQIRNSKK